LLESQSGRKVEAFDLGYGLWDHPRGEGFRAVSDYKPDLVILEFFARNVYVEEAGNDLVDNYNFYHWYETRDLPKEMRSRERDANQFHMNATKEFIAQHCNLCKLAILGFGGLFRKGFHPRGNEQRTKLAWQITEDELKKFDDELGSNECQMLALVGAASGDGSSEGR